MKVKQGSFATQSSFLGKEISPFIAVTFAVGKIKPEKKNTSDLYGVRILDFCDTSAALLPVELTSQLEISYESYFPKNI